MTKIDVLSDLLETSYICENQQKERKKNFVEIHVLDVGVGLGWTGNYRQNITGLLQM